MYKWERRREIKEDNRSTKVDLFKRERDFLKGILKDIFPSLVLSKMKKKEYF